MRCCRKVALVTDKSESNRLICLGMLRGWLKITRVKYKVEKYNVRVILKIRMNFVMICV